ncbi:hypothetical protein D3C85_1943040 [compost metagenome]
MVQEDIQVIGLGDLAERVAGRRTDQCGNPGPPLVLLIGAGDPFLQRLVAAVAALVFGLFGT